MNKKDKKKVVKQSKEDLEIQSIAHYNASTQIVLLFILIVLFGFTLFSSLIYINRYYNMKKELEKNAEVIEISNKQNKIIITNNGEINKTIKANDDSEIIIESIDTIEIISENYDKLDKIYFDIRYNILENTFTNNMIATNDSDVLVRFSYSFDNTNWEYVNNAITINNTNISPLMSSVYDIAGIVANIKVLSNYEITTNPYTPVKVYWRCETIINGKNNIDKSIKANFKIEYKESK